MDWGWVSTGVVGLAGIFGTLWQGKRSREAQTANLKQSLDATAENLRLGIDAENQRARIAEKRRIYARYMTALDDLVGAAIREAEHLREESAEAIRDAAAEAHTAAYMKASNVLGEVYLIAPARVRDLALKAMNNATAAVDSKTGDLLGQLLVAMRADLGEPVEPAEPHA